MKVELIDHMGSDLSVVNAARVSFEKISEAFEDRDAKLIRYLAKHNHWTPFGHAFVSFRIKAPIFVARQLGKHQVGLVWNEVSRRYVDSEPEFYVPVMRKRAPNVKQGSLDEFPPNLDTCDFLVQQAHKHSAKVYEALLALEVAPEIARGILPQTMMTEWVWSGSLAAFARVCKLRLDSHTQVETRQVAEMIDAEMSKLFPVSWAALIGAEAPHPLETNND